MGDTRATVRTRIRESVGDMDPMNPVVSMFRYNAVIERNKQLISAQCQLPSEAISTVSLVSGTYQYTLSSESAKGVTLVLLNSTGDELFLVPWEQFNAYYRQDTADPRANGTPREYTIRESSTNTTLMRFGPTPNATDSAKVHVSLLAATESVSLPSTTADTATIYLPNDLIHGLVSRCCAEVALMLSPEKRAALGLSADVAAKWLDEAKQVIHDYNVRQGRLGSRQDYILRYGGRRARHAFWGVW
jgi:hypothetical protein